MARSKMGFTKKTYIKSIDELSCHVEGLFWNLVRLGLVHLVRIMLLLDRQEVIGFIW